MHEAAYWSSSSFITLTYDDAELPGDGGLDQAEFTRFWKRLRRSLGGRRVKYFGCGEYGETNGRPHYHAIVFGLTPCVCEEYKHDPFRMCLCADRVAVFRAWGHGGVPRLGSVTYDSARYCADYIGKKLTGPLAKLYGGRAPPFQLVSKGLGARYVRDHADQLRGALGVTVHGVQVGLPRYYSNKLGVDWKEVEREFDQVASREALVVHGIWPVSTDIDRARVQRDKDVEAKVHLFRKGKA